MTPHLHIEDLYKSYGGKMILDNVDISVAAGEFCIVLGPSGCGKSTLLRLILGQEEPDSGRIEIHGDPAGFADPRRGVVYQRYSLFPHLSVLDNVTLGLKMASSNWRAGRAAAEEQAKEFLLRVRLDESIHKYPHELSGGMQQRVAIVQSLITKPSILLMDEPFGALDPSTREDLQLFLIELWEQIGMTVFFITHDVSEALFLGTRLLLLSQYYSDDRHAFGENCHGAKIVMDLALNNKAVGVRAKDDAEFARLKKEIMMQGYDPAHLQHVESFDLHHPHSFQTLTPEESNASGIG